MHKVILKYSWAALAVAFLLLPRFSQAHCDTMTGPVIITAQAALEKGDITPVLKWVKPEAEQEIRDAFAEALAVRSKGPEAKALADKYFFETLVRVHRAGEGAPFTGVKNEPPEEIIMAADKAIDQKSSADLSKELKAALAKGVEERLSRVAEAKKHAEESVAAGREYVEAYVEYVHYIERLHADIIGSAGHHADAEEADSEIHHNH